MKLLIGLGNPGAEYALTRHNIGFMAVEAVRQSLGFPSWVSKCKGFVSKGRVGGLDVVMLLPQTYMNLSGESVQAAAAFYKIAPADVLVCHDDIDLPMGTMRYKVGGGDAGHNGLKSMTKCLGTADYGRLRLGVGRPVHKSQVSDYVLGLFTQDELLTVSEQLSWLSTHMVGVLETPVKTVSSFPKPATM